MTADQLRKKFLDFFIERNHKLIPSASLIPENDPSVLFTTAGMHPLVPYLLGEIHPSGKRLCSVQKCIRTGDIEVVGDSFHQTFFEMLGNWSLGDPASPNGSQGGYWKEEIIPWSFEFLTSNLSIPLEKLSVTCFAGDKDAPRDEETANLWQKMGVSKSNIYFLGKEDNWWGPAGKTGPCGPDTEMFFDTGKETCSDECRPGCGCGKYFEIWNDVFMEYNKTSEGRYEPLKQRNIDTGFGLERNLTVLNNLKDSYTTDLFWPVIEKIQEISQKNYEEEKNKKPMRIMADHIRASVFIIAEGIEPSNTEQGYVLRRLIRRSIRFGRELEIKEPFTSKIADEVIKIMGSTYPEVKQNQTKITEEFFSEEKKFSEALSRGMKEFTRFFDKNKNLCGADAFLLYESYGFPFELTCELAKEKGCVINQEEYQKALAAHQEKSRTGAEKKFAGGLADHSEITTKYHTVTHLLHQALREVLGESVHQAGSNITIDRLRFDFTHPEKLSEEQLKVIEEKINDKIQADLPVKMEIMDLSSAKQHGALAFFEEKYTEQVKVYSVGDYSKEVCGGPHVVSTAQIGKIKIFKEESCGAGKRRIYVKLV